MDNLSLLVFFATACLTSAQLNCYYCSHTYVDSTTTDPNDCATVDSGSTTSASCSGDCSTRISLNSNYIQLTRGCETTSDNCNECTDPEDCNLCCDGSDDCNSATLESILQNNKLTQTCYKCRYSEVPGVHSDTGCGLAFDASSTEIDLVECHGMCYSSFSRIPGVEDLTRGCSHFADECDYGNGGDTAVIGRDNVIHDISCCMGDKCNSATTITIATTVLIVFCALGMLVSFSG